MVFPHEAAGMVDPRQNKAVIVSLGARKKRISGIVWWWLPRQWLLYGLESCFCLVISYLQKFRAPKMYSELLECLGNAQTWAMWLLSKQAKKSKCKIWRGMFSSYVSVHWFVTWACHFCFCLSLTSHAAAGDESSREDALRFDAQSPSDETCLWQEGKQARNDPLNAANLKVMEIDPWHPGMEIHW